MRKTMILFFVVFSFGFDYLKVYNVKDFKDFKMYKDDISDAQKQNLLYLYKKYKYGFMPYIATLTQQHLFILEQFFKKYRITIPKDSEFVGKFDNISIQQEYQKLLIESLKNKKIAAKLSVRFMNDLVREYQKVVFNGVSRNIKSMLLKLNAFNKKVLYRFKKGLRNYRNRITCRITKKDKIC